MNATRRPRDAGFTLPELLVSISILGVIMTVLGAAVIGWLRYSDATTKQLSLSHDVQLSAAYFARDVAATGTRANETGSSPLAQSVFANPTGASCVPSDPGSTWIVGLASDRWTVTEDAATRTVGMVVYYLTPAVGEFAELHRLSCGTAGPPDQILARNVQADPDLWELDVACVAAGCDLATAPDKVTLTFKVAAQGAHAGPAPNPIDVTLTGQRRQS